MRMATAGVSVAKRTNGALWFFFRARSFSSFASRERKRSRALTADAPGRPPRLPRTPCRTPARLPRREAGSSPPASRGETRRTEGERYGRDGKRHPSRSSRPTTDAANIGRLETRGDDTSEVTRVRNHRVPSSPWLCLPRRTRRWSSRTRSPPSRLSTRVARCDGCRGGKKPFTTERVSIKHMNTSHK